MSPRQASTRKTAWVLALLLALLGLWAVLTWFQWRWFGAPLRGGVRDTVTVFGLVNLNILLLLLLLYLSLRHLTKLVFERRRGVLGARLKTRLVLAFLALTVIPTALLFLTSAGFLARSIDTWFSGRVGSALGEAMEEARAYYRAEEERVLHHARRIAEQMARAGRADPAVVDPPLEARAQASLLAAVGVFGADGGRVAFVTAPGRVVPEPPAPDDPRVVRALAGEATAGLVQRGDADFVRGAAPIRAGPDGPVLGAVLVDVHLPGRTVERFEKITAGFEEYQQLQVLKMPIKASYILPLLLVALLIVFAAIWFGFYMARGITGPIQKLAEATQRVAGGDLDFQLDVPSRDEVGTLVDSFNRMTRDLKASKAEVEAAQATLRRTNEELDRRRRYMETVLGRIAAGVAGTDPAGNITTMNPSAREILGVEGDPVGRPYHEVLPAGVGEVVTDLLRDLSRSGQDAIQRQVVIDAGRGRRSVMVHLTTLRDEAGAVLGTVAVFDDLTELVRAQRAQAWQEVARRIAHEIKNPLTPIQLSAQRVRRRYADLLERADGEVLDDATRTIVSQVEGLKHLVNEFSRFAKMPESRPSPGDLNHLVEEVVALYRPAHGDVRFVVQLDPVMPTVEFDPEQLRRVCVNLLDNAVAAVSGAEHALVEVLTEYDPDSQAARLVVADNGPGLSPEARERLFEPYFSTKKGGTGLGLAIVKSVVADHRGFVRAVDNQPQGTRFVIELPVSGASLS